MYPEDFLNAERTLTWYPYFKGKIQTQEYTGPKGEVLFEEGILGKIMELGFLLSAIPFLAFGLFFFAAMPSQFGFLLAPFVAGFIAVLFFCAGGLLSAPVKIFDNCIVMPLPVFLGWKMFTAVLPKATVTISPENIEYYRFFTVRVSSSRGGSVTHHLELHLYGKTKVEARLGMIDHEKLLAVLEQLIGKEKQRV